SDRLFVSEILNNNINRIIQDGFQLVAILNCFTKKEDKLCVLKLFEDNAVNVFKDENQIEYFKINFPELDVPENRVNKFINQLNQIYQATNKIVNPGLDSYQKNIITPNAATNTVNFP